MEIFEERLHPIFVSFINQSISSIHFSKIFQRDPIPPEQMTRDPDHRNIYRFVRNLFSSAQLTAECAIITLVSFFFG